MKKDNCKGKCQKCNCKELKTTGKMKNADDYIEKCTEAVDGAVAVIKYELEKAIEKIADVLGEFAITNNVCYPEKKKEKKSKTNLQYDPRTTCPWYLEKRSKPIKNSRTLFAIRFRIVKDPKKNISEVFDNVRDLYTRMPALGKYNGGGTLDRHVRHLAAFLKKVNAPIRVIGYGHVKVREGK